MGFFDLFIAFLVLWLWSLFLNSREGSSVWVGRWQWVVGLALGGAVLSAAGAPLQSMGAPPPNVGEVVAPGTAGATAMAGSRSLAYLVLGAGAVWLVGLSIQTFAFPVDEQDADAPAD